jgi:structural maintenance of chromosome 1
LITENSSSKGVKADMTKDEMSKKDKEFKDLIKQKMKVFDDQKKLTAEINSIEEQMYAEFLAKVGMSTIQEFEGQNVSALEALEMERSKNQKDITRIENELKFLKSTDVNISLDKLKDEDESLNTEFKNLGDRVRVLGKEVKEQ